MNFAHFHPVFVHLPIGIWIITSLLYLASRKNWVMTTKSTFLFLLITGILFALLSITTGFLNAFQSEIAVTSILFHIAAAATSTLLATGIFILILNDKSEKLIAILFLILLAATSITGHFGGSITHGENYLFTSNQSVLKTHTSDNSTTHFVEIKGMQFTPQELAINTGDTVLFINKDLVPHDVVDDSNEAHRSPKISPRNEWKMVFTSDIKYHCSIHPSMKGSVTIKE